MAPVASPFSAQKAAPRGLWRALVEADAARSVPAVLEPEVPADDVIPLAVHAHAHLGYLERVAAGDRHVPVTDGAPDGSAGRTTPGSGVVIDLAQHRSRRSLSA